MKKSNSRIFLALTEKNEDHVIGEDIANQSMNESRSDINPSATPRGLTNVSSRTNLSKVEYEQSRATGEQITYKE
jgi:hypothetical protein